MEPVELTLGYRHEPKPDNNGIIVQEKVYRTWQYVPIAETIKSIMSQRELADLIQSKRTRNDGIIEEFYDGSVCENHILFSDCSRTSLILELYYDNVETANPIGSKMVIHKMVIFYFTIKNLPASYNSNRCNIHLLGLAYTLDLKQYRYAKVLEKFAEDIKALETHGVDVVVDGSIKKVSSFLTSQDYQGLP